MRRLLAFLLLLPMLLALLLAAAAAAMWQRAPAVPAAAPASTAELARALSTLQRQDPRRAAPPGRLQTLSLTQHETQLLVQQAITRWRPDAAFGIEMHLMAATVRLSLPAPRWAPAGWINVQAQLIEDEGLPLLHQLQVGHLQIPSGLALPLLRAAGPTAARALGLPVEPAVLEQIVRHVQLAPQVALVSLVWQADSARRLLAGFVPPDEQQRLRAHHERLAQLTAQHPAGTAVALPQLLTPMFEFAGQRSRGAQDASAENRAALAVLGFYATGRRLTTLMPEARDWSRLRPLRLTLRGRDDFPQHFLASAVMASHGSTPLSDAVGLYKELLDARRGSGFSFNDMAANRAGTRLGERATRQARELQRQLARGVVDADLMPDVADLPEFMPEAQFVRRFGGVDAPAYRRVAADIEARLEALPLLR